MHQNKKMMKKEEQFIILPVLIYLGRLEKFRFYIGIKKKNAVKDLFDSGSAPRVLVRN